MIVAENLSKTFRIHKKDPGLRGSVKALFYRQWHDKHALRDLNLRVEQGEMVGLLGANGAGKTTLVKVCTGIVHASSGSVRVLGFDPWQRRNEFRKQIALIMGQKAQLWWDLPAADCFLLLREIYQIPERQFNERVDELTAILNLKDLLTTQIRRLSLGERMKMELVAALLHEPKMVFLDEPTIGLDIASQRALRQFILSYHRRLRPTIILTSHYMEDIESLCQRIVIIREGGVVYDGGLRDLVAKYARFKFLNVTLNEGFGLGDNLPATLQDIHPDVSAAWGEVVSADANEIKLKIDRQHVQAVSSALLQRFKIADLTISDSDVGTIVSQIQGDVAAPV